MKIKSYYVRKISKWLLPYTCIMCQMASTREQDLCQTCLNDFPLLLYPCLQCAKPLPFQLDTVCGDCLKLTPPFDCTYALFAYQAPVTRLIMQLKFNHALINARILGELLATKIQQEWYANKPLPEVIIPIPLHPARLKERGFNQALEIARPLAKQLNLTLNQTVCFRSKHTAAQATLPAKKRQENIKNAFQVREEFSYQHVAVIDDVITTGFTVAEFCKTLKKAGAQTIDVWCCARPLL